MDHAPLVPWLVHCRREPACWGHSIRLLGPTRFAGTRGRDRLAVGMQNRRPIGGVRIGNSQVEQASACTHVPIFDQRVGLRCSAFARYNTHHEVMRGIEGDVIPGVSLCAIRRIAGIAVFLLFPHKGPLLVELHLTRLRRKRDQHTMEVVGMFACQ